MCSRGRSAVRGSSNDVSSSSSTIGGSEQDLTVVLDGGGDVEVDESLAVGCRHELMNEIFGDRTPGHAGPLCGGGGWVAAPASVPLAERGRPSATTVLRCAASWSISPSFLVAASRLISRPPTSPSQLSRWASSIRAVSYTHLRAHETDSYLVCRLLLEKK